MPLFALANAGVVIKNMSLNTILTPVPLGIICGLFFGKQIGVFLFSFISVKLKLAEMPTNSNWVKFYGVGILTGIGFTMSLFVGNLAFVDYSSNVDGVKNWCFNRIFIVGPSWLYFIIDSNQKRYQKIILKVKYYKFSFNPS